MARLPSFVHLPTPVQALLAVAAGGGILFALYMVLPGQAMWILFIGMAIVGLITAGYIWLLGRMKKRRARPLEKHLMDHGAATPQGVSEAAARARLDDLRRNFDAGVGRFRSAGKDLYSLPWYVIVGESGSGKTEAIRHCNVGFPPGLHDEFQGVGGTINMNWWFTNHAVILDTAGRIMFDEVASASTSEWKEFLRLLKTYRPNCPINGLFLVLPADSLVRDTADQLERKGAKIAQQLDLIQRELDVRFPVFVIVTKSDLIHGFREFFDRVGNPELQHQMLGWSNPAPLDEPFRPETVETHLQEVVRRLQRRRLGLLADPVHTEDPQARRTDQVDALFDFPQSLQATFPRLRRYLEMIFVASEWTSKPLFLRGIYFTSAMREGAALDADLAEALGVPVESLPEGKMWERDRAYFIRDVLMKKAFREKGLVTRASNANRQHRARNLWVMGTATVGILALIALTVWGGKTFFDRIGRQRDMWYAAKDHFQDQYWSPILDIEFEGAPRNLYRGEAPIAVGDRNSRKIPLAQFHRDLYDLSRQRIEVPWIFSLISLGKDINEQRRQAQRIVYDLGVLRPLLDAARAQTLQAKADLPATQPAGGAGTAPPPQDWAVGSLSTAALAELLRLQADALAPRAVRPTEPNSAPVDLGVLFRYVLAQYPERYQRYQGPQEENLRTILRGVYGEGGESPWPTGALELTGEPARAAADAGVECFIRYWSDAGTGEGTTLAAVERLTGALEEYARQEALLVRLPEDFRSKYSKPAPETLVEYEWAVGQWRAQLAAVRQAAAAVAAAESALQQGRAERITLLDLFGGYLQQRKAQVGEAFGVLLQATRPHAAPDADLPANEIGTHVRDVRGRLTAARDDIALRVEAQGAEILARLQQLQDAYLARRTPDALPWYAQRERMYVLADEQLAAAGAPAAATQPTATTQGWFQTVQAFGTSVRTIDTDVAQLREQVRTLAAGSAGTQVEHATAVCDFLAGVTGSKRKHDFIRGVLAEAPGDGEGVADLVASMADALRGSTDALRPIERPAIPMTNYDGGEFASRFHPGAAGMVFATWKSVDEFLRPGTVGGEGRTTLPLEPAGLWRDYEARRPAMDRYLELYLGYWTGAVVDDLRLRDDATGDWEAFLGELKEIRRFDSVKVMSGLTRLGDTVAGAIEGIDKHLDPAARTRVDEVKRAVDRSRAILREPAYQMALSAAIERWRRLPSDVDPACGMVRGGPTEYIQPALSDDGYVGRYWKEFSLRGLRLLGRAVDTRADRALQSLKAQYAAFPLVLPAANARPPLTLEQVEQARGLLGVLPPPVAHRPKDEIRSGDKDIDAALAALSWAALPDADLTWAWRMRRIADALAPYDAEHKVKVSIAEQKEQDAKLLEWLAHVYLLQDTDELGSAFTRQSPAKELGTVRSPGKAVALHIYQHPDDKRSGKPPRRIIRVDHPWALLRLLHPGSTVVADDRERTACEWRTAERSSDGTQWHVQIAMKDATGTKDVSFVIVLEFNKGLPALSDWPGNP